MERYRFAFATVAVWLALIASRVAAPAATHPAAAMFRADAAHRGVYESAAPTLRAVRWTFRTGGRVIASPTVSGGIVYAGSADRRLYALRASSGALLWSFATGGAINSTAAVADGRVVFAGTDGYVYALDARRGKLLWRFATGGERRYTAAGLAAPASAVVADAFDVFSSSPAVAGGTLYVGSGDRSVYALDAATGKARWRYRTGDVVHASPAVADGAVYAGSWDGFLYKLDAASGKLLWKFGTIRRKGAPSMIGIPSSPAVAGGAVYFGSRDGNCYAVDAATGKLRWRHDDKGSWVVGSPAVRGGVVYVTTSDELKFFALEAATGARLFAVPYATYAFSSPSYAAGFVYYGTFDGVVHAVDTHLGREVATFATAASKRNAARVLDSRGHIRDDTYGNGSASATTLGISRLFSLGSILSSPVISNGTLYVGSTDGNVYALE
jgi:outer membrane protein assembly factor BamB